MMMLQGPLANILSLRASAADAPIVSVVMAASKTVDIRLISTSDTDGAPNIGRGICIVPIAPMDT
jgi:hypothetical protein